MLFRVTTVFLKFGLSLIADTWRNLLALIWFPWAALTSTPWFAWNQMTWQVHLLSNFPSLLSKCVGVCNDFPCKYARILYFMHSHYFMPCSFFHSNLVCLVSVYVQQKMACLVSVWTDLSPSFAERCLQVDLCIHMEPHWRQINLHTACCRLRTLIRNP